MKFHITFAAICAVVAMASAAPSPTYKYSYPPHPHGSYPSYPLVYGGGGASGNAGIVNSLLGGVGRLVGGLVPELLGNGYDGNNAYPYYAVPVPVPSYGYEYERYPPYGYPNYGYGYGYPKYGYPRHH